MTGRRARRVTPGRQICPGSEATASAPLPHNAPPRPRAPPGLPPAPCCVRAADPTDSTPGPAGEATTLTAPTFATLLTLLLAPPPAASCSAPFRHARPPPYLRQALRLSTATDQPPQHRDRHRRARHGRLVCGSRQRGGMAGAGGKGLLNRAPRGAQPLSGRGREGPKQSIAEWVCCRLRGAL